MNYEKLWDQKIQEGLHRRKTPHWTIPEVAEFFKKHNVKKILDLGCGAGRHLVYFAKRKDFVVGIDTSPTALSLANKWLRREKLSNYNLVIGSMLNLPFPDNEFDAVVSIAAIDNFRIKDIQKAVNEVKRVLKRNGFLFANFASTEHESFKRWKEFGWKKVDNNTFFHKIALLQAFITKGQLLKLLSGFRIIRIWEMIRQQNVDRGQIKSVNWEVIAQRM